MLPTDRRYTLELRTDLRRYNLPKLGSPMSAYTYARRFESGLLRFAARQI